MPRDHRGRSMGPLDLRSGRLTRLAAQPHDRCKRAALPGQPSDCRRPCPRKKSTPVTFQLSGKAGDTYELRVRQVAPDKGANAVIDEDSGTILATADLMTGTGGLYEFLPGAEMDDMRMFILPAGTTVAITAAVTQHKNRLDEDSNSVSTVLRAVDR